MGARGRVGYRVPLFRIDSWRFVCLYWREPWTFRTDYFNCDGNLGFLGPPVFCNGGQPVLVQTILGPLIFAWTVGTFFCTDYWNPLFRHGLLALVHVYWRGPWILRAACWGP